MTTIAVHSWRIEGEAGIVLSNLEHLQFQQGQLKNFAFWAIRKSCIATAGSFAKITIDQFHPEIQH
jgi:hypothetical protein